MYFLHTNEVKIQLHGLKTGCKVRTHTLQTLMTKSNVRYTAIKFYGLVTIVNPRYRKVLFRYTCP